MWAGIPLGTNRFRFSRQPSVISFLFDGRCPQLWSTILPHAVTGCTSLGATSDTIAVYPVYCVCSLLLYEHMLDSHKSYQTPGESSLLVLYQEPSSILPYLTSFSSPPLFSALTWAQHLAVRYPLMSRNLTATIAHYLLLLLSALLCSRLPLTPTVLPPTPG